MMLTPSQYRVLAMMAEGMSYGEIALSLGITVHTVQKHLMEAYRRLGVEGHVEAFIVMGWLRGPGWK